MRHEHADLSAASDGLDVKVRSTHILRLGASAFVEQVDAALAESPAVLAAEHVHVELSAVTHFDISGLLRILEMTAARAAAGRLVSFRLPVDPAARHILRRWRFPKAVAAIVRSPFSRLVHPDDLKYFGESVGAGRRPLRHTAESRASVLAYLVEQQHFGFAAYPVDSASDLTRMLISEVDHWSGYAIMRLLERLFGGRAPEISRVVVPELVSNVVEHTAPTVAVVASQLALSQPHSGAPGSLTISAWDNGASIVQTLRDRMLAGASVRAADPHPVPSERLTLRAVGWSTKHQWLDTCWTPDQSAQDQEILVASLFPGITRKAVTTAPTVEGVEARPPRPHSGSGYGLYALHKTVTETLGGTVEVRSEENLMCVERLPGDATRLRVTVTHDPEIIPMPGDVVTVRIPVTDA